MHGILGNTKFEGWDNQLYNEPLLNFVYARGRRWPKAPPSVTGTKWDLIGHWSYAVGNRMTNVGAGAELRFGHRLPEDFEITASGLPDNTAMRRSRSRDASWTAYFFLTSDYWWAIRDITLDGNTFRESHQVDKRPFVAEVGCGTVFSKGAWQVSIVIYRRTREFERQPEAPAYGAVTITFMPPAHS